jgi:cytohesin
MSHVRDDMQKAANSATAKLGVTKSLAIRSSWRIHSPMIWCWKKIPVLLVPNDFNDDVDWSGVICHELAHYIRRDHISGLITEIIASILCWNPLLWFAKKRLIRFSEQACDDWVIAGGQPVENYARSLLSFKPQKQAAFVPAVVHSRKGVATRVRRILKDSRVDPRTGVTWVLTVSIMAACLAIGVACAQTRPAKPVSATVETQKTPTESLHKAVAEGNIEQVKLFISEGTDVNAQNAAGKRPLHIAARSGQENVVELLIDNGADVNGKDRWGYTPLIWAVWRHHRGVIKLLVTKGADVNFAGPEDSPPLHYAIWREDTELAEFLVNNGADFNLEDHAEWSSLRYAVDYANRELVDFLIAKGAKLSEFHLAAWRGDLTGVGRFLDQGADVNIQDSQFNWTPLYWASFSGQRDVAEFLISKGADVNARDEWNDVPLHYAAVHGHRELTKLLLTKGAEVNARTTDGKTPLYDAVRAGHRGVAELLIAGGADVNAKYTAANGMTALHRAVRGGYREVIELLIAKGANVNAKDENGQTPLHVGARNGHVDVVRVLLAKGADVTLQSKEGHTALDLAKERNHTDVVELLKKHGAKE